MVRQPARSVGRVCLDETSSQVAGGCYCFTKYLFIMAKGSAMGLWKGKKGSSVFYKIANSNSAQKQGIRERVYEVSNPQSSAQAGQRMRMYPAQAVYGAIKDVIERSWQGIKYGEATRREYLKGALRTSVFPAISKGMGIVVPGPYQIAKGTLQEYAQSFDNNGTFIVEMPAATAVSYEEGTIADLATSLLTANPQLKAGDQLAFVLCYNPTGSALSFVWDVISFELDTANTQPISEVLPSFIELTATTQNLQIASAGGASFWAAAMIVSREATTPMRSNATLVCRFDIMQEYYSAASKEVARRSYMKSETTAQVDWPADPITPTEIIGSHLSTYTITGLTGGELLIFNGAKVIVYRKDSDDSLTGVATLVGEGFDGSTVSSGPCLVDEAGTILTREFTDQSETVDLNLLVSKVTDLADLRQVPFTMGA